MFEEVKTISWTCDLCHSETRVQNLWRNQLDRPVGWVIESFNDPHSSEHYQKDICSTCSKDRKKK
jgi:hypothetical protein